MPKYAHDWEDPEIFQINTLKPHASASYYPDSPSALLGAASPWEQSLNGPWHFRWSPNPSVRPADFYQPEYDARQWETIPVPSNWEMHGYSRPQYINIGPRPGLSKRRIPTIDHSQNQVGCYRRKFTLPDEWQEMQVRVRFDGVRSAFYLYINGHNVGYSQGSNTPSEFDITAFLHPGDNLIAAEVYSLCDGTYLEDQDMWRLSGIFRDVTLVAVPKLHLADFYLTSELDENFSHANFRVQAVIESAGGQSADQVSVRVRLLDADGSPVGPGMILYRDSNIEQGPGRIRVAGQMPVPSPHLWSAESPYVYCVLMELLDSQGQVIEAAANRFGFRKVEIRDRQILVNGQPVIMKGVNRHEWDPRTGQVMTPKRIEADIQLLKQYNINAVRTTHYPNHPFFYDLCDRYGIYVMDEANLETHGVSRNIPAGRPEWRGAVVNRMERMVLRDRNHACILFWSLGNEAGHGENFLHMKQAAQALDDTRLFHYEGDHYNLVSDVTSTMYPSPGRLEAIARAEKTIRFTDSEGFLGKRIPPEVYGAVPVLICEYAHAMGNSVSQLDQHMRIFETYPHVAGGYIWDFADQAVLKTAPQGEPFWAYGGDFDDYPNDGNFCINGLFDADRQPHPHAVEVKKVYQDMAVEPVDLLAGQVLVRNRRWFTDLSLYTVDWELLENGDIIQSGEMPPLRTPPGGEEIVQLPYQTPQPKAGAEYHLTVRFRLAQETAWAHLGHLAGWEQFRLPLPIPPTVQADPSMLPAVEIDVSGDEIVLVTASGQVRFDPQQGLLTGYTIDGLDLIAAPLVPNFWRAPLDNDSLIRHWFPILEPRLSLRKYWAQAADKRRLSGFSLEQMADGSVEVHTSFKIPYGKGPLRLDYTVRGNGEVQVRYAFTPRKPIVRVGLTQQVPAAFNRIGYFGLGPHETMPDRNTSGIAGVYRGTVEEMIHDYTHPQENGNRSEVRWVRLADPAGRGLEIRASGDTLLNFSAWPYTQSDLEAARHIHELPRRTTITLNIDYAQKGVGDLFSYLHGWPKEITLPGNRQYHYQFVMRGIPEKYWS